MSNFLEVYLEHTKIYESPTSFWKWASYALVAAVIRDNCRLKQGDSYICPNIFVLLLADSAAHRKGRPVTLSEGLLTKLHATKVISGRSSIQAILDELARGETDRTTGKTIAGGSALFIAPELSAGLVADPDAIKILTDIYDYKEEYTSRLRGSGTFKIKNLCFSMLAASNAELLRDNFLTAQSLFGGLLGRTFLIVPSEFRKANSLFSAVDTSESYNTLMVLLKAIKDIKGDFSVDEAARKYYDDWYIPFRESYKDAKDKSGVLGRLHTGVLKLAMILCVAQTHELIVRKEHVEQAINECMALLPNYKQFMMSGGKSTDAQIATTFLQALHDATEHTLSRREILARYWMDFSDEELTRVTATLLGAGMITETASMEGITYTLTKKCLEMLYGGIKEAQ